ncbi:MAG TPA: M28 family peptidase, partial [Longimicrobiaceae bacterium]|nr:M28 family peptidase [Longimicrobiaceae bacterium]
LALAALPAHAQAPATPLPRTHAPRPTTPAITPADAMTRLYILADDSMLGREAGGPGNVKGTNYIAREAQRMGLEPAGENGTFFQTIPFVRKALAPGAALSADGQALRLGDDFLVLPNVPGVFSFNETLAANGAQVVYGGQLGTSSLVDPAQTAGKVVVFDAPAGPNGQKTWRFWTAGGLERYAQAAAIAVVAMDVMPAGLKDFLMNPQEGMRGEAAPSTGPAGLLISNATAQKLLGAPIAGMAAGTAGKTVTASAAIRETPTEFPARNVVAILRGTDPALRGQFVAIGAHNDHVGTAPAGLDHDSVRAFNHVLRREGLEDEPETGTADQLAQIRAATDAAHRAHGVRRDSVFNGADDDGSGTTGVLEIAEYLAAHRPKRSILFVWHTGEEKGLLGSNWFTEHPTPGISRDSIVAQLNMDMIGRGATSDETGKNKDGQALRGGPHYLQLVGSRRLSTQLGDLIEEVNRTGNHGFVFDYSLDANGHPGNIYCRSDHYSYARWGIPITFFTTGLHEDYHQVSDEPQYIDYQKLADVSSLVADIALHVANNPAKPVVDHPKPDPHGQCRQ